jgi:rubrerythrin
VIKKGGLLMSKLKGSKTEENLLKSFIVESQARNKYDYFASQAKKEGYEQIANVFAETAINEKEHAKRFFKFLEGGEREITAIYPTGIIGTTEENLKTAIEGEKEENSELYPEFAKVADEEGFSEIADIFRKIAEIEKEHEARYSRLLEGIKENKEKIEWRCVKCGYVYKGVEVPDECPVCERSQDYFVPKNNFMENYYQSKQIDHGKTYYQNQPDKGCYFGCEIENKAFRPDEKRGYHNSLGSKDCYTGCENE